MTDRRKKFHLVSDQVGGWANRVVSKLNTQLLGNEETKSSAKNSLTSLFDSITNIVCDQLQDILRTSGSDPEDTGTQIAREFLKDLDNEEFFAKNFRVRPVSGANDDRQSEHHSRNNLTNNDPTEEEDKVNKMLYIEMEEQRKKIKQARMDLKQEAEGHLSLVGKLAGIERAKDKERNINKKLKKLHQLSFPER